MANINMYFVSTMIIILLEKYNYYFNNQQRKLTQVKFYDNNKITIALNNE